MSEHDLIPDKQAQTNSAISRRDMLLGMGAAAAMAYTGNAMSAMPGHDHSKHSAQNPNVLDAVNVLKSVDFPQLQNARVSVLIRFLVRAAEFVLKSVLSTPSEWRKTWPENGMSLLPDTGR